MVPLRLRLLNLARWVKEYFLAWGLLSGIYSLTLALLLQPLLERELQLEELKLFPLWAVTCGVLLLPGILEALPLSALPFKVRAPMQGLLGAYLRHDLRRLNSWLVVAIAAVLGALMGSEHRGLWILAAQLPTQRALYSVHRWRGLALISNPEQGARALLKAIWGSQLAQAGVAWLLWGALSFATGSFQLGPWLRLGLCGAAAVVSASSVAFEGDSGRPWVVNFMSLAAGVIGGYLCAAHPSFLILELYLWIRMFALVKERLRSVEHLDEDVVIS